MTRIIRTDNGDYRKPTIGQNALGIVAGSAVASTVQLLPQKTGPLLIKNMKKQARACDTDVLIKGVEKAKRLSKLDRHGVEIINVKDAKSAERFKNAILDCIPKKLKNRFKSLYDTQSTVLAKMVKRGDNAFFAMNSNTIGVNMKKLGTATFHEMGHAMNRNCSKVGKLLQKMRTPAMALGALIPLIGLCKRKKAEGEEPRGFFDKVTTFIKNNVGKLTTLAFVPVVAEELMATAKGNKLAKKVLSPDMFKKVVKTNRFGAASYIGVAVAAGVAAWAGSKIRDAIAKPKQIA